jgi:hypothetical protein
MSTIETRPKPILIAESVRKVYRSGADSVVALHGLDLVVPQGEFVAVMVRPDPGRRHFSGYSDRLLRADLSRLPKIRASRCSIAAP